MPTSAGYVALIGEERIISVINDGGNGVAVPKLDVTSGGLFPPNHPDKGNRKIILGFDIQLEQGAIRPEDQSISIRVKVPAGIIRNHLQRFKLNLAAPTPENSDNPLDFSPIARIVPQSGAVISARVFASLRATPPNEPDAETQTLVIGVENDGGTDQLNFAVEIDFYHSINN